jgi:hypothetical protein
MISFNFGGRVAIHPGEALYYIGYSRTLEGAKKTARNLMSRNAYPLPLFLIAPQRRVVRVTDLLHFVGMDEAGIQHVLTQQPSPVTPKRGPGRPRKTAQTREADHEQ